MDDTRTKYDQIVQTGVLFIPAGIFLGFAFGFLYNNIPAGIFFGLRIGFVAFVLTSIFTLTRKNI